VTGTGRSRSGGGARLPCPRCGGASLRIVYGLPTPELEREARRGRVVLGGCGIDGTEPTRQCRACGHEWRAGSASGTGPWG
jgi:hypothetical protein